MGYLTSAGTHTIIDGLVRDPAVFSKQSIMELFSRLIAALEMKALDHPHIYDVPVDPEVLERVKLTGQFEDEGGITGVVVVSTSHITIHCWPLRSFFSLDAFSCKSYNVAKAKEVIFTFLDVVSSNVVVLDRQVPA